MSERDELHEIINRCSYHGTAPTLEDIENQILAWHERNREKNPEWCEHMVYGKLIENEFAFKTKFGSFMPISIHDGWEMCPVCGKERPK